MSVDFNIGATLRKRLEEITQKKENIAAKITTSSEYLQRLFSKNKTIRSTPAQLDAKIEELERQRTTTSLPLAEEKRILREIDQIKKSKIQISENAEHERLIQATKAEIDQLRTELRTIIAQIAELTNAIGKIDLADRLGCTTNDLQTSVVDCPAEKLGHVIGKGGSNLKLLEKKTGCIVDVDKVKGQVHLRGNDDAIQKAVEQIENITQSVEEEVKLSEAVHDHFFSKRMEPFKQLQKDHSDVYFDLSKDSKVMKLRGKPHFVSSAKEAVASFDIIKQTIDVAGRETAIVVGKGGVTINAFVEKFNVGMNVERINDEKAVVEITGVPANVNAAVKEINFMLFKNEDIETSIVVSTIAKNSFLEDSGALIKKLQKDVNEMLDCKGVRLNFENEKEEGVESSSKTLLVIRAPRAQHLAAVEYVKKHIAVYESKIFVVKIDQHMIPKIIGKKGETINAMRKMGKGGSIEIDRISGGVSVLANDEESKKLIKAHIEEIIAQNQLLQIPVDSQMMGLVFGAAGKGLKSSINSKGVQMTQDGSDTVMFRGTIESITEAAVILREFVASNYTIEVKYDASDAALLGRRDSFLGPLAEEGDVRVYQVRGSQVVEIRGTEEKARAAAIKLKEFLYGGDGLVVKKMCASNLVLGSIIGKGGSGVQKLEKQYDGVSVDVNSNNNMISIRGPENEVKLCRADIMKQIVKNPVNLSVPIDAETHEFLSNAGNVRKMTSGTSVKINLTKSYAKLRGNCVDINMVKANIEETMTGSYNGHILLTPPLFQKVSTSSKTEATVQSIQDKTDSQIDLNANSYSIEVSGKRANVKRAKTLLLEYMIGDFTAHFSKIKVPIYLLKLVANIDDVTGCAADSGSTIAFDHDINSFIIQSDSGKCLSKGSGAVEKHIDNCKGRITLVEVSKSDSWIISTFLRNKEPLKEIEQELECRVEVYREESAVGITGDDVGNLKEAEKKVLAIIEQTKKENRFMDLPESSVNHFVGQSCKHMNRFAGSHGVKIERVKRNPTRIHIKGSEAAVKNTELAIIEWIDQWEKKDPGQSITLDRRNLPYLLGSKGSADRKKIQQALGVKIDINTLKSKLTVRGGKRDSQKEAIESLENLMKSIAINEKTKEKPLPQSRAKQSTPEVCTKEKEEVRSQEVSGSSPKEIAKTIELQQSVDYDDSDSSCTIPTNVIKNDSKMLNKKETTTGKLQSAAKLYNFLVSDDAAPSTTGDLQEPWDSSTVSSAVENVEEGYFRSSSGFTIRL